MANKKRKIELGIDLQVQNYDSAIKYLEAIEKLGGGAGASAKKLKAELINTKNALVQLGGTATPKVLEKFITTNLELNDSIEELGRNFKVTQARVDSLREGFTKSTNEIKEYEEQIRNTEKALKKLNATKKSGNTKTEQAVSVLNSDKNFTAYKKRMETVGKNKPDSERGSAILAAAHKDAKNADSEYQQTAINFLKAIDKQVASVEKLQTELKQLTEKKKEASDSAKEFQATLNRLRSSDDVYKTIRNSADEAAKSIERNTEALSKAKAAAERTGQSQIELSNLSNEASTSLGKAAKSVFNYTVLYQGLKRVLRESVRTVKEMDDAITGMTVVTNLSREEAWKQIDSFKEIAKATSSTMTEIAGLTTEYLKQGRAMKEAKILAEETAKSAKIAGISTAEAVQYMTSAINGFNLAASDATRVSDVFANLAAASATDFEDLAIAVSKVSAQANLAGMSLEYTTALLAKGIETTQEAPESIGTALKTIVARMRELSSYGSVLEDGASVNKVERALASAGIELRNVNGEFRDLEEIFSELGPKWDYLNTMQQQAIAQAVAGTRQQSRFVAIMQDWGRTQELIADANASEGASAAQYAEYANGIEAALTRMKTSWEGFVQGLANNKVIIGGINVLTNIIEMINKIPGGLKASVAIYASILLMNKLREQHEIKMKAYRQMGLTEEEKRAQAQGTVLEQLDRERKSQKDIVDQMKRRLKLAEEIEQHALEKNNNDTNSIIAANNLEVVQTKKKSLNKQLENSKLPDEKRAAIEEEIIRLTTIEQNLVKEIGEYRNAKLEEQRKAVNEIVDKEKELNQQVKNAEVEIDITEAIQQIAVVDKEIQELNKKKQKDKKAGKDTKAIDEEIEAKKELRKEKISEVRKDITDSNLDKETKEKLRGNLKASERGQVTLDEANAKYKEAVQKHSELEQEPNSLLSKGTMQWNIELSASKAKLIEIEEQLKKSNLTAEEKSKLLEQQTLEEGKQLAIKKELEQLETNKKDATKELDTVNKSIETIDAELQAPDLSQEDRQKKESELLALQERQKEIMADLESYQKGTIGLVGEQIAKQKELNDLKKIKTEELESAENDVSVAIASGQDPTEQQEKVKQLKGEILVIDEQISGLETQIKDSNVTDLDSLEKAKQYKLDSVSTEERLQELNAYQMSSSEQRMVQENEAQIAKIQGLQEELELRKQILESEIASLETELKNAKEESKEQKAAQKALDAKKNTLDKLNKTEKKNKKDIAKLEQKNKKIQDGSLNIYTKMADLIGSKLGVNIRGMVDNLKTVGDFAKQLYMDFGKLIAPLWTRKKAEEEITEEKQQQNLEETKGTGNQIVNTGLAKVEEKIEEDISEEKKEQTGEEIKEGVAGAATLVTTKGQEVAEKGVTKEKKKGFFESVKNAIANISSAAGQPYGIGLPFALAGIALLALVGVGASIALGSAGAGSDAAKEQKIAGKQTANYEMKKTNAKARSALDEYEELQNKEFKTEEDKKRLEELKSEMQELDEHFAGLKGDALIKAVRGRVAAQEIAIEDNIKDSFDTALSMDDINGSSVAQQAIADKIVNSQEKLIASNAELVDATEEEVEAVKNNAADMASEISKQMDWNSYGNAHDYNAWDYVGAAAGTLLLGSLLNPVAGILGGGAGIAAMIAEDKAAEEQQKKMEEDIAKFERASVEMAAEMATADEDLASQVAAFDSGLAELTKSLDGVSESFEKTAKDIVKEQYGTVAYVSEMNAATNGELLKTISKIQEKTKGTVTEDAMLKMADAVAGSSLEDQKILEKLKAAENTSYGSTSEGWAFFSGTNQSQNLDSLRENLKDTLGDNYKNATINEIKEALTAQIKRNDDGTLKQDINGNYAFKDVGNGFTGNNKELTEIFNNIANLSEELGDFANLSSEAAGYLIDWTSALTSSKDLLINAFKTIDENLYSNEELLGDTLTEHQKETGNAGYAFAKAAQETADIIKREGQAQIDKLTAQQKEKEVGSEAYNALQQTIDKIRTDMNSNAADVLAQAKQAVGYLSDSEWLNRVENLQSKRDNIQDIREAFINKEDLTVEQTQRLWNEIIPDLQKLDPSLGYAELKKIFDEQGLEAVGLLSKYLDDFKENSNLIALNSVGSDLADVDYALQQLTSAGKDLSSWGLAYTTDKDGNKVIDAASLDNVDQQAIADEIKKYKDENDGKAPEWADEYNKLLETLATYWSHKDQQEASQVAFEREAVLTADEIKRANLEAKIAATSEDASKHRLSVLELEIDLHKQLADELAAQVAKKQKIITDDLASMGVSFDEVFDVVNGQVIITADKYDKLSDDVKEYITMNIDGFKDIVAAEYEERKAVIDGEKEKFEETINLQETMIDAYKSKLEEEQEAVEETLDKRKELYQEYFDWLNDQEDQDEQENDIEILRERIANLSGATDAASLKALKEAQEELADLEKESIQSEQEKIQEQILANLDKQSEQVEEYYKQQHEDNQAIINAIRDMPQNMVLEMLRQADGYYNLTEEQKAQKDQEYQQLLDGWQTSNGATLDGTVGSVATEEPEVEVETTTTTTDTAGNASSTTVHSTIHPKNKPRFERVAAYADGGLVDYTGPAWVDGTPGKPEAFLNAEQTALFGKLGETLVAMSSQGVFGKLNDISASTINNNLTIENFDITINADMKDDQDLYETGNNLADVFFERIQASGIPVNIKK